MNKYDDCRYSKCNHPHDLLIPPDMPVHLANYCSVFSAVRKKQCRACKHFFPAIIMKTGDSFIDDYSICEGYTVLPYAEFIQKMATYKLDGYVDPYQSEWEDEL